ncbi:MAG: outer membrane protein assembly factor BamA [Rhodospirillaceae bacterium]|nr:outer membrane protein assembly factor BamA [Rhodospirillaceae bacterium]
MTRIVAVLMILVLAAFAVPQRAFAQSDSDTIEIIAVQGNQRVEPATIRTYLTVREGDTFDPARIDRSIKNLFATSLFADVSISRQGSTLLVRVVENPIVNRVQIEGNNKIKDEDITKEIQLRARVIYTRTKVQQDVEKILELYRRKGRFAARVEPKVIELPQNRVDLAFEITEGQPTYVRTINFVGNESYGDGDLRSVIQTREERWWRIFSSSDTYDPDRMNYDRELLRRHYLQNGFADFEVISSVAELSPNRENFYMTFTIKEGPRYKLTKVDLDVQIKDVPKENLQRAVIPQVGDWFNAKQIEDTVDAITDAAGASGYAFVDVSPQVQRDPEAHTIAETFHVREGPRVFVERIDITGNNVTVDKVLRREMILAEGDAFNTAKVRRSKERLQNLGFFKEEGGVTIDNVRSETYPDRTILKVKVEEDNTGEIQFGVGYSSASGALFDIGISQRNLLGTGNAISANLSIAQQNSQVSLSYTNPYFQDRRVVAGFDLVASKSDYSKYTGYTSNTYGGTARIGFQYNENLYQRFNYQAFLQSLSGLTNATSQYVREQAGSSFLSQVSQVTTFDKRNNIIDPTRGYFIALNSDLAGLGGDQRFVRGGIGGAIYTMPFDGWIISAGASGVYIVGLGQDVKIYQRSQLGGQSLRGFEDYGASPRDASTGDALGGDWMVTGNVELRVPLGLPQDVGIKTRLFTDWGIIGPPKSIINSGAASVLYSTKPRGSAGFGFDWKSPVGVISVDYALFIVGAQPFDRKTHFRINFGQRFQ